MFRLFHPAIIRELRSLTEVTLVIYAYDGNGMIVAVVCFTCRQWGYVAFNITP